MADIQFMRLCQRESLNKEFYDYYEKAQKRIHRIEEDEELLSPRQRRRMVYARSEFAIVTSTYYYYVGLEQPSIKAISQINPDGEIQPTWLSSWLITITSVRVVLSIRTHRKLLNKRSLSIS